MSEGVHTLNEFLMQTKGVLYLISVGYLIAFVAFWKFLHGREKKGE
jgi:hypothetical protein